MSADNIPSKKDLEEWCNAVADILCWSHGYAAGRGEYENHLMVCDLEALRKMKAYMHKKIEQIEEENKK